MTAAEAVAILDTMHLQPWSCDVSPVAAAMHCLDANGGLQTYAVVRLRTALPGWYVDPHDATGKGLSLQNMRHPGFCVDSSPVWWPYPDELATLRTCLELACKEHVANHGTDYRRYAVARVTDDDGHPTFTFHLQQDRP